MIIVNVNLKSAISSTRDTSLAVVHITNDGTGNQTRRNYTVELFSRGDNPRLIRKRKIENWPAKAKPAWRLIAEAFKQLELNE